MKEGFDSPMGYRKRDKTGFYLSFLRTSVLYYFPYSSLFMSIIFVIFAGCRMRLGIAQISLALHSVFPIFEDF
ncbi:hypothetical protein D0T51_07750 [Parabacteroides sp. 52]|nr:hypothetical protein [Parabacteroides sp. 52]